MGRITFIGGEMTGNVVGISVPNEGGPEIVAQGLSMRDNGTALEVRDRPNPASFGLRDDIPSDVFLAAVTAFRAAAPATVDDAVSAIQPTGLERWVAAGANLATVATFLMGANVGDGIAKLIATLGG